jgi:outer membrane protein OmpA-like peptidoglycan-associated protein
MFINNLIILFFCLIFFSCSINNGDNKTIADNKNINSKIDTNNNSVSDDAKENNNDEEQDIIIEISDKKRQPVRLNHHINTSANEYLPVLSSNENKLFFSAMDRTGYFDFKLDFTKQSSSGGEDIFYSDFNNGIFTDARPVISLNTNGHEVVSHVFNDESLILTANYPEKIGPVGTPETETTDIFFAKKIKKDKYTIYHLPEPVNSIFSEADAFMPEDQSYVLFVSDRPGHVGEYHKKGWKWNDSFWGNTDVYVSVKNGDMWGVPINLGNIVNSEGAERTPWLSKDGLTLFISSNGKDKSKNDLDVYAFTRKDKNSWTKWTGPILIKDASSQFDDWGYKETIDGNAYIARVQPLGFKPTQGGTAGDGYIRETNYRPGYSITGQQIASLNSENTTDIFLLKKTDLPIFTLNEVFFEFNSAKLNPKMTDVLVRLVDMLKQNESYSISIKGFTDDIGDEQYNLKLSQQRAEAVKTYLMKSGIKNYITTEGIGEKNPKFSNDDNAKKQFNRRVEIYFDKVIS